MTEKLYASSSSFPYGWRIRPKQKSKKKVPPGFDRSSKRNHLIPSRQSRQVCHQFPHRNSVGPRWQDENQPPSRCRISRLNILTWFDDDKDGHERTSAPKQQEQQEKQAPLAEKEKYGYGSQRGLDPEVVKWAARIASPHPLSLSFLSR